jgi:chromosome segregation ATPase
MNSIGCSFDELTSVEQELRPWLDPNRRWEDRVELYRRYLQEERCLIITGPEVPVVLREEAEEQLKETLQGGRLEMSDQQRVAWLQEQVNEAHRQLSRHDERFTWIAQRLKSMDERDQKAFEDIATIKERIFNGFGEQIATTNANVEKISKTLSQLSRYFQRHLNTAHLTKEEAQEIARWVHSQGVDEWEGKEQDRAQWLKSHKLEIIAVATPILSGLMVLLATVLTSGG